MVASSSVRNHSITSLITLSHTMETPKLTISRPTYNMPNVGAMLMIKEPTPARRSPIVIVFRDPNVSARVPDGSCMAAYM